MRYVLPILSLVFALAVPTPASAQEPSPLPKLTTAVAFPNLKFDRPVAMAHPDDGSNRLFVVEQHVARIQSFANDKSTSEKQLFLQLPDPINKGNEEGFLGLAFHPKSKENGQFFVYYSANDKGNGGVDRRSVGGTCRGARGHRRFRSVRESDGPSV